MHIDQIEKIIESRSEPMIEMTIAQIFVQSFKHGDHGRLTFLLDRAIGKVPVVEPTDEEARALEELRELTDQELVRLVKEKLPELESK